MTSIENENGRERTINEALKLVLVYCIAFFGMFVCSGAVCSRHHTCFCYLHLYKAIHYNSFRFKRSLWTVEFNFQFFFSQLLFLFFSKNIKFIFCKEGKNYFFDSTHVKRKKIFFEWNISTYGFMWKLWNGSSAFWLLHLVIRFNAKNK